MAISTNGVMLTRLTGALYNQQLSAATYSEILAGNSTAAALNAWANATVAADFGTKTDLQVATTLITNVGLSSVAGLANWVAGQLAAGGTAKRGETIISLLNSYSNMDTTEAIYGASVATFNTKVDASQALSQTTGNTGGTFAAVASVNTALTLTSAVQTSTGTAGDDTFTAAAGAWGTGDIVNGGAGSDTLNATVTGTAPTQSATSLVSIETLNLTASPNPATLDLTGVTGLTSVNNVSSANGASLAVSGLGNVVNTSITGGNTSTTVNYTTAVTAATALTDAATLTLNGTSTSSSFSTAGVETLTVNSATAANTLASLTNTGMTKLNITGSQALTVTAAVGGTTIATVDASAATGAITLATGAGAGGTAATGVTVTAPTAATAGLFTITTGANKDTVTTGGGSAVIDTGAGNDTITTGAGATTVTPGTGNDALTLGAGVDTVRFAETGATNADTITNFGATDVVSLNLGTAAVTGTSAASASVFGTVQTGGTSPVLSGVGGTGTGTAISFQAIAPNATATSGTVLAATNVIALNGAYTDGTVAGAITALGTSATTGITTTAAGKFLLVTYAVGNIAQVWSYAGDTVVDTNITEAELSLVATLNGVAQNSLTAANFSTYLTAATAATTTSNAGQTINLTGTLNTVSTTSNASGQFFTAANDVVNVGLGSTPTGTSATVGMVLLDSATTDSDTLNATVLNSAWDTGTTLTNIETVNLAMTVADTGGFAMTTVMPGTTSLNVSGAQNLQTISGITSGTAFGLGANGLGYTGTLGINQGAVLAAATLNLNGPAAGTTAATSPTFTAANAITALTVNANAASSLNTDTGGRIFNATAATLTGSGALTIFGTAADFDAGVLNASGTTYTGALTLRPSTNAAIDLSAGGVVTGVRTVDLRDTATFGSTITFAAANNSAAYGTTGAIGVSFAPTSGTTLAGVDARIAGTALTDALTVTLGSTVTTVTNGVLVADATTGAAGFETLAVNSSLATGTLALGTVRMSPGAGTQTASVTTGGANVTIGDFTGDSINLGTVTGTVTIGATGASGLTSSGAGVTVTGSPSAVNVIYSRTLLGDAVTGGIAADVYAQESGNMTGGSVLALGLGNDTYSFAGNTLGTTVITDTGGVDTLLLPTAGNTNISSLNNGAAFLTAGNGLDQLIMEGGGQTLTVAPGQLTGSIPFNFTAGTTAANFTLSAPGALNLTSLVTTAGLTYTNASNVVSTGVAGVVTGTSTGTSGIDSITGTAGNDTIAGGGGADVLVGGNGTNTFNFASAANLAAATVTGGTGTDTIAITGDAVTLVDANFTAAHTLLEALTLGTGTTSTTLGAAAVAAGIATVNTGTGATTITATAPVTSLAVVSNVADGVALNIGAGATNYTITNLLGDLTVSNTHTGNIAVTVSAVATTTVALGTNTTGTHDVTATALTDAQVLTLTGSDAASVSLVAGDLSAAAYTGVLTVTATTGTNVVTGGTAGDTINLGAGADSVVGGAGADTLDGEADSDLLSYSDVTATTSHGLANISGMAINLTTAAVAATDVATAAGGTIVIGGGAGAAGAALAAGTVGYLAASAATSTATMVRDTVSNFEQVLGSALADVIYGPAAATTIDGGAGVDSILGGAGADVIIGGAGADKLTGAGGSDTFKFSGTTTALNGADTISDFVIGATGDVLNFGLAGTFTLANAVVGTAITLNSTGALATEGTPIALATNKLIMIEVPDGSDIITVAHMVTAFADGGVIDALDITTQTAGATNIIVIKTATGVTTSVYAFIGDGVAATHDVAEIVLLGTLTSAADGTFITTNFSYA